MTEIGKLLENQKACANQLDIKKLADAILKTQLFDEVKIKIPRKEVTTILTELIETNREILIENHHVVIGIKFYMNDVIFTFRKLR